MKKHFKKITKPVVVPGKADTLIYPKTAYIGYLITNPGYVIFHPFSVIHTLKTLSSGDLPPYEW